MPVKINMDKIKAIESGGEIEPQYAYNKKTGATGAYQILPGKYGALADWNAMNPYEQYSDQHLFDPNVNYKIANWYMNIRIPQMLKAVKLPDTEDNRLWAYNAGVGNVKAGKLPKETVGYIQKYRRIK